MVRFFHYQKHNSNFGAELLCWSLSLSMRNNLLSPCQNGLYTFVAYNFEAQSLCKLRRWDCHYGLQPEGPFYVCSLFSFSLPSLGEGEVFLQYLAWLAESFFLTNVSPEYWAGVQNSWQSIQRSCTSLLFGTYKGVAFISSQCSYCWCQWPNLKLSFCLVPQSNQLRLWAAGERSRIRQGHPYNPTFSQLVICTQRWMGL